MASAAPSFSSTKETTNYARLCRLLVDVGTQALRDTFDRIHPPSHLHRILATSPAHTTLTSLRKRKILNATQWGKLYPTTPSLVSSASFDISLLMVLLRNICGLGAPASTGSWDILPPASDNSIEANIARIKYYRNNVYGHATQASIDEPTFRALWRDVSNALLALGSAGSYTSAISRLKTDCMDPDAEEHYCKLLKEWKKDDDITKDKLEQLEDMLKTQEDKLREIQESLEKWKPEVKIEESFSVEICRAKLQEHYIKTSKVRTSVWSSSSPADIDQVYTRLFVTQRETTLAGSKQSEVAHYSYLFFPIGKGSQPKKILVQGETGIGKSTFAKKLAVDWARLDEAPTFSLPVGSGPCNLQPPGTLTSFFQFFARWRRRPSETMGFEVENNSKTEDEQTAVLRKSSTQGNDEQTAVLRKFKLVVFVDLKEVSKCQYLEDVIYNSSLFAREDKWLVEGLLKYMTNHQDEVLLLLDGYDEYHGGQESQIFNIFRGNELRDCCVLITSRISKAGELQKFQDLLADITGFSDEDKLTYITRQLGDNRNARDLYDHLKENKLRDLAKVPLLLHFFCTLWKKEQSQGFSKGKTSLYSNIVQHILSHNQEKNTPPRFSTVEDNSEILNQVGNLALECLLNDDHIFSYGKLSSEVLSEESVAIGLLQVTECTESLQPTEMVSFIHKSIQEFLAAWYVTHKCIPDGNLGLIEEHTQTLKSCRQFENVFRFICGLSDEGAAKVFDHLKSVRKNDPSLDISEAIPDEGHKCKPLDDAVKWQHVHFNHLVFDCFEEVHSKQELAKLCVDCFVGIIVFLMEPPTDLALLFSGVNSWTFIFVGRYIVSTLYKVVETLNVLDASMKITENSEDVPLGVFLRKFLDVECEMCDFLSILHIHDGDVNVYFRDLKLSCDAHTRLFTESAQAAALPNESANLVPGKTSFMFLSSFSCSGPYAMKDLGAVIKSCTHLMRIFLSNMRDSVCIFLQQLPNPSKCDLELSCLLTPKGAEQLAKLLPRFQNITTIVISLRLSFTEEASLRLVSSITHKTLVRLSLDKIHVTPAVAQALGFSLPRLSFLRQLRLVGTGDTSLNVEDMLALFGRIDNEMPLEYLTFRDVSVSGSISPLTSKLSFFPHLTRLHLECLHLNECDLQDLESSACDIPNLEHLSLRGNTFDHLQKPLASFLVKLGKIKSFYCVNCQLSGETLQIQLEEELPHLFVFSETFDESLEKKSLKKTIGPIKMLVLFFCRDF